MVAGGQGLRVVGAQHPQTVVEQLLERGNSPNRIPNLPRQ
jgi:hypothetical protein